MPTNNKKYVHNANGTRVLNIITHQPILIEHAVNIATPSGMLKTYDARSLYDWFIKHNNDELRGYISHLTRDQRKRIIKLYKISKKLRKRQVALQRKSRIKGTSLYNNSSLYMLKILKILAATIVSLILLYLITSVFVRVENIMFPARPVSMRNVLAAGSSTGMLSLASLGSLVFTMKGYKFILDAFVHNRITELQRRLEKYIDGIPLRKSDIRTLEYLTHIRNTYDSEFGILASPTWHERYGNKLTRIEDKFTNLGFL
jgi:hypothetical protein